MQMEATLQTSRTPERFSETLDRVRMAAIHADQALTLREVVALFGPKGHVLLILFLNLPFCQPIPIPGLSTALGVCIMIVAYFMMIDQPPWIPERLARVRIKKEFLIQVSEKLEALMKKLEKLIRPRVRNFFAPRSVRMITGFLLTVHAFLLSLPLPIPFSNYFPAMVLFLLSLGTLEEDFFVMVLGYCAVVASTVFFAALVILPYLGIKAVA